MLRQLVLFVLLVLTGCLPFLRPAKVPMEVREFRQGDSAPCLAILLPGRFGGPESFVRAGFIEKVRDHALAMDVLLVDAHLGYYRERSVVERLRVDVLEPVLARDYREIWLVGTSLGGLGTLLYTKGYGEDLTGVLALAPFLGEEDLIQEIEQDGGARAWTPRPGTEEGDFQRLWQWLKAHAASGEGPPLWLGVGQDDDFAPAVQLLSDLLPPDRSLVVEGGHDWKVWRGLWDDFLRRGICQGPAAD